jgi:hypothetical protein
MEASIAMLKRLRRVRGQIPDFTEAQVCLIAFDSVAYRLIERMNRFWGLAAPRAGLVEKLTKLPSALADIKRRRGIFTHEHDIRLIDDSSTPILISLVLGAAETDKANLRSLVFSEARAAYRRRIDASLVHVQAVRDAACDWAREVFFDSVLDWEAMIFGAQRTEPPCPV